MITEPSRQAYPSSAATLQAWRLSSTVNRALVVAAGCFGARALGHLWARMRFEDYQRDILRRGLPSLRRTTSYCLLLPMQSGRLILGRPNPAHWDDDDFVRQVVRLRPVDWEAMEREPAQPESSQDANRAFWLNKLPGSLAGCLDLKGGAGPAGRAAYFHAALDGARPLGDCLVWAADQARIDQDAPGREAGRFTAYVIASLAEPEAAACLWPLVKTLRSRLEPYLALDVNLLLNTGVFGAGEERRRQGAAVFAALRELDVFARAEAAPGWLDGLSAPAGWRECAFFDHCYLLDSEKQNLSRSKGEDEAIVALGNILETLLLTEAPDQVAARFGPDEEALRVRGVRRRAGVPDSPDSQAGAPALRGPFATAGAASVYIPIDDWRARHRRKYLLEVLRSQFLAENESAVEAARAEAEQLAESLLAPERLVGQMIQNCPFSLLGPEQRGEVGALLRRAGQDRSLTGAGPSVPIPVVQVHADVTRLEYRETDPQTGRHRRLDPEEWLGRLYRHYCRIGLVQEAIFPGDSDAQAFEKAEPAPQRTQVKTWRETMILARDSSQAPADGDLPEALRLAAGAAEAGIVPDLSRLLRGRLAAQLRLDNQGLRRAIAFAGVLGRRARAMLRQVADYRVRLARAGLSAEEVEYHRQAARLLLGFRQLLADRPRIPGLFARALLLAALLTVTAHYGAPAVNPLAATPALPLWSAAGGAAAAGVVVLALWIAYWRRLRGAIRRIENELRRRLNLQVNQDIAALLAEDEGDGLLPDINGLLTRCGEALSQALNELREREAELERDLSEPLTIEQPFLRQPLAGLEDLQNRLEAEARGPGAPAIPPRLLADDPERAGEWLEPLLARALDDPRAAAPLEAAAYDSLGDLLLAVCQRRARRIQDIAPPRDLKIETLLRARLAEYSPRTFLADLRGRTQPLLAWDDEALAPGMPTRLELLSLDEPAYSDELGPIAAALKVQPVASLDPFAITCLRLVYGLRLQAVPHFRVYKDDWRDAGPDERERLKLADKAPLGGAGEYLEETAAQAGRGEGAPLAESTA